MGPIQMSISIYFFLEMLVKMAAMGVWADVDPPSRAYMSDSWNVLDFVIVLCGMIDLLGIGGAGLTLLRVLRVVKLLFSNKYLAELLELAFSSARTIASLITFLFFVITLVAIMGMHMFAASCHEGQALPSASFGSFWRSVLVIFQIITIDNWGGITYYYMDCYGNGFVVTMFFSFVFVFINFVVINLFTAVFIENFELSYPV